MTLYAFRLSLECPKLSLAELDAIVEGEGIVYASRRILGEYVLMDINEEDAVLIASRAAFVKEFGEVILIETVAKDYLERLANEIVNNVECVGKVESVRNVHLGESRRLFEILKRRGLFNKCCDFKIVLVDGFCLAMRSIKMGRERRFGPRAPHKRPAYLPGTMTPWLARAFVNLAAVSSKKHEVVLDPFCGVGGFALEAAIQGITVLCGDIDLKMVKASLSNLDGYDLRKYSCLAQWDAANLPLRGCCVDAVATDPPYGRMSIPRNYELASLIIKFLDEAIDVVRKNRRIVFAVPIGIDALVRKKIVELHKTHLCEVIERIPQFVHSTLTRVIYVVRKM